MYRTSARARAIVEAMVAEFGGQRGPCRIYVIGRQGDVALWAAGAPTLPLHALRALTKWQSSRTPFERAPAEPVTEQHGDCIVCIQPLTSALYECAVIIEQPIRHPYLGAASPG